MNWKKTQYPCRKRKDKHESEITKYLKLTGKKGEMVSYNKRKDNVCGWKVYLIQNER